MDRTPSAGYAASVSNLFLATLRKVFGEGNDGKKKKRSAFPDHQDTTVQKPTTIKGKQIMKNRTFSSNQQQWFLIPRLLRRPVASVYLGTHVRHSPRQGGPVNGPVLGLRTSQAGTDGSSNTVINFGRATQFGAVTGDSGHSSRTLRPRSDLCENNIPYNWHL